jgi:hypothetical protein
LSEEPKSSALFRRIDQTKKEDEILGHSSQFWRRRLVPSWRCALTQPDFVFIQKQNKEILRLFKEREIKERERSIKRKRRAHRDKADSDSRSGDDAVRTVKMKKD